MGVDAVADKPNFKAIDKLVRALPKPATGNRTTGERELRRRGLEGPWIRGLGLCLTAAGSCSWVMQYRAAGIERLYTIGSFAAWPAEKVWPEAARLRREIDAGADPRLERKAKQEAPTVNDLADRFEKEHLPKRRPVTVRDYKMMLRLYVRPALGTMKVAAVRRSDIDKLHRDIASGKLTPKGRPSPYTANRVLAVLSKMFSLAVGWEMRPDNPARGIERAPEEKRQRFLTPAEIARLSDVLATHPERTSANVVRLLLLTGARKSETLAAKWADIDFAAGVWVKPGATTKQKTLHRVPLSAPALQLLSGMKTEADLENARRVRDGLPPIEHVFPSTDGKPLTDIKHLWAAICSKAGLVKEVAKTDKHGHPVVDAEGKPATVSQATARVHDLRHTYASILASAGLSLPIIGQLLGHTQPATTARYAHLLDDPLRAATERAGAVITGAGLPGAEVVPLSGGRRA